MRKKLSFAGAFIFVLGIFLQRMFSLDPFPEAVELPEVPYHMSSQELDKSLSVDPEISIPQEYVRILYFHRDPGCATCQKMSKMVFQIVKKSFSEEARKKKVVLRYYDFEESKNEKLTKTFRITSPSLVILQMKSGNTSKAKFADQIWPLSGNSEKFFRYVEKEIREYLDELAELENADIAERGVE